jgi:hypothetical protein
MVQQNFSISELESIESLSIHPLLSEIYGSPDVSDIQRVAEYIKSNKLQRSIAIDHQGRILSEDDIYHAFKLLGHEQVPVTRAQIPDEKVAEYMVSSKHLMRRMSMLVKYREMMVQTRALEQPAGRPTNGSPKESSHNTRKKIAEIIGRKEGYVQEIKRIGKFPKLFDAIDSGEMSFNEAHETVTNLERVEWLDQETGSDFVNKYLSNEMALVRALRKALFEYVDSRALNDERKLIQGLKKNTTDKEKLKFLRAQADFYKAGKLECNEERDSVEKPLRKIKPIITGNLDVPEFPKMFYSNEELFDYVLDDVLINDEFPFLLCS